MRALPELLVLRHGETEWNLAGRFQGARDSALTPLGRVQAEALGGLLGRLGVASATHDALTSPQGRARETARLALGPLGLAAREDARLVEIGMGCWTGLSRAEIDARWPAGEAGEGILGFYARCPDGEPLEAVAERVRALLEELSRPAVIVTHGITLRMICALAAGGGVAEAEAVRIPQGALARVVAGNIKVLEPGGLPGALGKGSAPATGG